MKLGQLKMPTESIKAFCARWKVRELSVFGSALRADFRPDSDIDVMVSFEPGVTMTFDSFLSMREELSVMFDGREIDLVEKRLLKNPFRRHEILTTREVVYAA